MTYSRNSDVGKITPYNTEGGGTLLALEEILDRNIVDDKVSSTRTVVTPDIKQDAILYLPFWNPELEGSVFNSADKYSRVCTVTGTTRGSQGRSFDGTDDVVDCGSDSAFNFTTQPFSIVVWFKETNLDVTRTLVCRGLLSTDGYYVRVISNGRFALYTAATGPLSKGAYTATGIVIADTWYCGIFTCIPQASGAVVTCYLNDTLMTLEANTTLNILTSARNLKVGLHDDSSEDWLGQIGEVLVYNRVLSAKECAKYYSDTSGRYR